MRKLALHRTVASAALVLVGVVADVAWADGAADVKGQIVSSVQRSVPFLQREGNAWIDKRKCTSCHQVPAMLWSLRAAHASGFDVDGERLDKLSRWSLTWQSWQNPKNAGESDEAKTATGNVDTIVALLLGRQGYEDDGTDDERIAQLRALILANQQTDGSWKPGGQLPQQRRPLSETTQVATMWALLALPPSEDSEKPTTARVRAIQFLDVDLTPISTEWHVARYLLDKQNDADALKKRLTLLLKTQNEDGGWGWLSDEKSDAYGTGLALFALSQAEGKATSEAISRAQQFLVSTQTEDGSWLVPGTKTSAGGKPKPTSNYWGTAWAVIGLTQTVD